jgi:hypothetical protein
LAIGRAFYQRLPIDLANACRSGYVLLVQV